MCQTHEKEQNRTSSWSWQITATQGLLALLCVLSCNLWHDNKAETQSFLRISGLSNVGLQLAPPSHTQTPVCLLLRVSPSSARSLSSLLLLMAAFLWALS